jgi:RNA polymerase sigma factor (sigma-70 family)
MATELGTSLLGHLRGVLGPREWQEVADAQLLTRYLADRDPDAFEAILRRHGAMVLGVCQRILGNPHDAEDAFQATFLVLVRKAAAIVPRDGLAGWLHGVAWRTAQKARTTRLRWAARGQHTMTRPALPSGDETAWLDLQPILDQELAALADIYRLPIVLCDLEGHSRKEAAAKLGWRPGTLSGRLARGRRQLAARLTRRGVALSAVGLTALLVPRALAVPPPAGLLATTLKAATWAGAADMAGVAAPVMALTREVLHTMLLQKLKTLAVVLVAVLFGVGAVLGLPQVWGGDEPEPRTPRARPPLQGRKESARTAADKLYLHRGLDFTVYDLRQKEFTDLDQLSEEVRFNYQADSARLSPDGRFLAFGQAEMGHPPSKIQIRELTRDAAPTVVVNMPGKELSGWSWSPDGKQLSFSVWGEDKGGKYLPYLVTVATKKTEKVKLPALTGQGPKGFGATIQAWSPDGLWLVFDRGHFYLVHPKTRDVRQVTEEPTAAFAGSCRFSPDGKKILYLGCPHEKEYNLSVLDLLVGKPKVLANLTGRWDFAACWSPDSRRIACGSVEVDEKFKRTGPCRVELYDADGKGQPQTLLEEEEALLTLTDWR